MPVQWLKVAITTAGLTLLWACNPILLEILTTAKSHKNTPDRQFPTTYKQNASQEITHNTVYPAHSTALSKISRNNENRTSVPNHSLNK